MGPTASGKTGLAADLVEHFPLEIISVDSALVYRGMDIGTAKPGKELLSRAPHRLIDICDPEDAYSAARFRQDALREIEKIRARRKVPLLVGGTMLYFRALLDGLSVLPEADADIRAQLEEQAGAVGWPAMHEELGRLDPLAASRINPNDPQRIQRALEVRQITGSNISQLQQQARPHKNRFHALKLVVCPSHRAELHRRIEVRFRQMLEDGFVEEVRNLLNKRSLHAQLPSMRAVGYRQARAWLCGELEEAQWQQKAMAATRQLAKRQLTWLRRESGALWYDLDEDKAKEKVFKAVGEFLNTRWKTPALSEPLKTE